MIRGHSHVRQGCEARCGQERKAEKSDDGDPSEGLTQTSPPRCSVVLSGVWGTVHTQSGAKQRMVRTKFGCGVMQHIGGSRLR